MQCYKLLCEEASKRKCKENMNKMADTRFFLWKKVMFHEDNFLLAKDFDQYGYTYLYANFAFFNQFQWNV